MQTTNGMEKVVTVEPPASETGENESMELTDADLETIAGGETPEPPGP